VNADLEKHEISPELLSKMLSSAWEVWRQFPSSLDDEATKEFLTQATTRLIETAPREIAPDMIAVQMLNILGSAGPEAKETVSPNLTVYVGLLAGVFTDFYPEGQEYPFFKWQLESDLRVRIVSSEVWRHLLEQDQSAPNTLVIPLDMIQSPPPGLDDNLQAHAEWIMRKMPSYVWNSFERKQDLFTAIQVALGSTRYTQRLMTTSETSKFGLPHTDERNLVFITVWVSGMAVGGAAIFSHLPLPKWLSTILGLVLRLNLYRVKSVHDIRFAQKLAREQAKWETSAMYVARLRHNVGHLLQQIELSLDKLQTTPTPNPRDLQALRQRFQDIARLIATQTGESLDELRRAASHLATRESLKSMVIDAVWSWREEANARGVQIEMHILPEDKTVVICPRFLVLEVLDNLVSNAVRYARHRIDIYAEHGAESGINIIKFQVVDDGPGFKEDIGDTPSLSRLPASSPHGRGLVLSRFIVTELLRGNDGLAFDSHPGRVAIGFQFPEFESVEGMGK
jgi:signal transduction histidine kinase